MTKRKVLIKDATGMTAFAVVLILGVIFVPDMEVKAVIAIFAMLVALGTTWAWCDVGNRWSEQ